jgi:hypothetical protein
MKTLTIGLLSILVIPVWAQTTDSQSRNYYTTLPGTCVPGVIYTLLSGGVITSNTCGANGTSYTSLGTFGPVWNRWGTVLNTGEYSNNGQGATQEPSVLYENSSTYAPAILSSLEPNQFFFRMYFTCSFNSLYTCYAESLDGINWVPYASNPIITVGKYNGVVRNGSTIHIYVGGSGGANIFHYTSTNGPGVTLVNDAIVPPGSGWTAGGCYNSSELIISGTWNMLLECYSGTGVEAIGLWTSSDGSTWAAYSGNPVISRSGGAGGPVLYQVGSTYYAWVHGGDGSNGNGGVPSDLYRFTSTNLTSWTESPSAIVFGRGTADEGFGTTVGQVADPFLVSLGANGPVYLYYDANAQDAVQATSFPHIKLAIANMSMAQLVTTNEGAYPVFFPDYGMAYNNLLPGTTSPLDVGGPFQPWFNMWVGNAIRFCPTTNCNSGLSSPTTGTIAIGNGAQGDFSGTVKTTNGVFVGNTSAASYSTASNCSSSASPAVCGSAPAGAVAIPTGITTVSLVVNTTKVTANSEITLTPDDSLTIPGVTCNSTLATLVGGLAITARTPGISFTISYNGTIATNPLCIAYSIIN